MQAYAASVCSGSYAVPLPPTSEAHPWNMESELRTLYVDQSSPAMIVVSPEQPENMEPIFVTDKVSQPERSREASEEQP